MATISRDPDGRKRVLFFGPDRKRRAIRLGKVPQKMAEEIRAKVGHLEFAKLSKCALDAETVRWVAEIGDELAGKLAAAGLIAPRTASTKSATLADFIDGYIAQRADVKPRTTINLKAARARLVEFFGADKSIPDIKPGDADDFLRWLRQKYAGATAGRTFKRAKQFFRAALRKDIITKNPFDEIKPPSCTNDARKFFVTQEASAQVLDACPDFEWRLIFALSRYAGLRCPSEHLSLKWDDIDWSRDRFLVRSPKTAHHEGHGERWVPLFEELRPHLDKAWAQAEDGAIYVIVNHRKVNNWRTRFRKIVRRAGLAPWPRLFHNLRASRETELADKYPLHVICYWIGNTERIAAKHYLQVTDDWFEKAARQTARLAAESDRKPPHDKELPADFPGKYAICGQSEVTDYPHGDSKRPTQAPNQRAGCVNLLPEALQNPVQLRPEPTRQTPTLPASSSPGRRCLSRSAVRCWR
jgi:integrase